MTKNKVTFDALELDALAELFNISVGYAASTLSDLTDEDVVLSVPFVNLSSVDRLQKLFSFDRGKLTAISQNFDGKLNGLAFLIFPENNAFDIIKLMLKTDFSSEEISEFEQDALNEIGNIILNTCFSTLADLLKINFECGLPTLNLLTAEDLSKPNSPDQDVLLIQIKMSLEDYDIESFVVFIIGVDSTMSLKIALGEFIENM
ncbi:chemotaxis protein CheX [Vibrio tritonius]|uniref:chemotaxis protein CheX n=1 Tax=Vibrio tritonius TaxID=1435069 RepID=UPI00315D5F4F